MATAETAEATAALVVSREAGCLAAAAAAAARVARAAPGAAAARWCTPGRWLGKSAAGRCTAREEEHPEAWEGVAALAVVPAVAGLAAARAGIGGRGCR